MAIKTKYGTDGKKERRPSGYGGGLCNEATRPYEQRERGTRKSPTPEAYDDPAVAQEAAAEEQLRG